MHASLRRALSIIALVAMGGSIAQAGTIPWSQNLERSELAALAYHRPVLVAFLGAGGGTPAVLRSEPFDRLGHEVFFVRIGADAAGRAQPGQIALEKKFNITRFPTFLLLEAVKTGSGGRAGDYYDYREAFRCIEADRPGGCADLIADQVLRLDVGE